MLVMTGDDVPAVKAYIENRLGVVIAEPSISLGFATSGRVRPLCAVLLNDYTGSNIEMTIVAERGGVTLGVLRYLSLYIFGQLGCRRVTIRTKKRNKTVQKMALRYGFTYESVAKHHYSDDDAVVYRMLRADCPWLKDFKDENTQSAAAA